MSQIYAENKSNVDESGISNTNEAQNNSAQLANNTNILTLNSNIKTERNIKYPVNSTLQQGILDLEMTLETIPGWNYQVYIVSQTNTSKLTKTEKCVISEQPDPYQMIPVYQAELGIHFRNAFCIPTHFLMDLQSLYFWDIILSKNCFSDMVKKLESRYYLDFIIKVISGKQCETILVPPINSVLDTYVNIGMEDTSLSRVCKDSQKLCSSPRRGQHGDGYEHVCLICRWLNVSKEQFVTSNTLNVSKEQFVTSNTAAGVVGTYFKIVNKIQNHQSSVFDKLCLAKNCYKAQCKPGELGMAKKCFNPISEVYGRVTNMWIKTIFIVNDNANHFDKIMTGIRDSIYGLKNVSSTFYIYQETFQSTKNCQVTEFNFNTFEFTEYRTLERDVAVVLDIFLKKAYSFANSSSNLASFNISTDPMYCPWTSLMIQNVSRKYDLSTFQKIGIGIAAAIVCVFILALAGLCFKTNQLQQ